MGIIESVASDFFGHLGALRFSFSVVDFVIGGFVGDCGGPCHAVSVVCFSKVALQRCDLLLESCFFGQLTGVKGG